MREGMESTQTGMAKSRAKAAADSMEWGKGSEASTRARGTRNNEAQTRPLKAISS